MKRREFIHKSALATMGLIGTVSLDTLLKGCATVPLFEDKDDVYKIKWNVNPAIHIPTNGCYVGWHSDIVQTVRAPYMAGIHNIKAKDESYHLDIHKQKFGFLPAVHSFSDRLIPTDMVDFPVEICRGAYERGVIPLIRYYFKTDFSGIAKGKYDDELKRFAEGANRFGHPYFFVPYPEINIGEHWKNVHVWAGCAPNAFKDAYEHIHDVFENTEANKFAIKGLHLLGFGDKRDFNAFALDNRLFDWIGFTIYNLISDSHRSQSFSGLVQEAYYWASSRYPDKPIALWELGTSQGHDQEYWIRKTYENIISRPRIKLAVLAEYDFGTRDSTRMINPNVLKSYTVATSSEYYKKSSGDAGPPFR